MGGASVLLLHYFHPCLRLTQQFRIPEPSLVLKRADATTSLSPKTQHPTPDSHTVLFNTADFFRRTTAAVVAGLDMMPGQIPDPSLAAGSLPSLGPLAGISATTLTDQLKLADFRQLGTMLSPLHFLGRLGKRPLAIKTEMDEDEERRKRRREKNKVAAARCRNKKKERTDFLQRESERLEMVNSELKAQIEELRLERQQLMVMLNLHRPTCIVRTDSVKTPESEANPLLEQLSSEAK